jgi:hypothetical protein
VGVPLAGRQRARRRIAGGAGLCNRLGLHDINPYDYFVDVLQRVDRHLASLVMKRMDYGYRDSAFFVLKIKAAFPGNP